MSLMETLYCIFFFQQRTSLIQTLWYCLKLVKINLIFHFQELVKALTLHVPGKMQPPLSFLIPIFDYQVTFNKHINAIKIFHIFNNLRMYDLII